MPEFYSLSTSVDGQSTRPKGEAIYKVVVELSVIFLLLSPFFIHLWYFQSYPYPPFLLSLC